MLWTPEVFESYCKNQMQSLEVAIERKLKGSRVEDDYFLEHLRKLEDFFLSGEVVKLGEVMDFLKEKME